MRSCNNVRHSACPLTTSSETLIVIHAQMPVDAGTPQIGVDQKRPAFLLAMDHGKVDGRRRFTFPRRGRRHQKRSRRIRQVGQQVRFAQRAHRFFIRIGGMPAIVQKINCGFELSAVLPGMTARQMTPPRLHDRPELPTLLV